MAKDYKREDILYPDQKIIQSELVHEMQTSYIEYAMSVIVGRALPDVRDGLKPVHRRILYAMYEDNLTSDKPFKKSATCVGDVLGRYHPHGDASVYDAMVRLAQDFSMRYMLVDGHGNFGSVDGDPPAAYRYTEARLSKIANEMLRDIDKDTVDWDPNFDETRREPRVLPCRFPNLLVNGSSGIAVGMATNIPPHNLTEVINACVCVLENPDATLSDLMQHVTGPDFPTKGIIVGRSGIRAAYATGRGRVVVRARTETETWGHDRIRIIVTELPYQVNKRQLIQNISEQVRDKKLDGISGLRDESDRNGMRIVIELKKDANTQVVLNRLFAQTQMQTTFAVNMLALVDNQSQPKILSLRHILDEYLTFQEEIIVRRTKFDLKKALERAHLLEGLLIAEENIDEVIRIIRESYDNAKENLMQRFSLSEVQAQAILDMRLKALQGLEREKLQNEYDELEQRIAYFRELLADPEKVKGVLRDELIAIRDKYGVEIVSSIEELAGLDAYLLESVDGAQHLEQFKVLAKFGKPVFIDKPLACSYSDARTLFDLAAQYNVPIMTASSMRFAAGIAGLKPQDETVAAAEGFGPMAILDDYRDYFWYGIHSAEIVYSYLGRGCAEVHTESNGKFDLVVGRWNDGRLGLVVGNRVGANNFGVRLTTDKRHIVSVQNPDIPYMFALAQSIDRFFRTGISPIDPAESLEVIAFLEAASRSRARDGVPVALADL